MSSEIFGVFADPGRPWPLSQGFGHGDVAATPLGPDDRTPSAVSLRCSIAISYVDCFSTPSICRALTSSHAFQAGRSVLRRRCCTVVIFAEMGATSYGEIMIVKSVVKVIACLKPSARRVTRVLGINR